jgi:hypothetical protein
MTDYLDERLKKTREFFDRVNYAYDVTLADALIDARARLAVLEGSREEEPENENFNRIMAGLKDVEAYIDGTADLKDYRVHTPDTVPELITIKTTEETWAEFQAWREEKKRAEAPQLSVQGEPEGWLCEDVFRKLVYRTKAEADRWNSTGNGKVTPLYASPPTPVAAPGVETISPAPALPAEAEVAWWEVVENTLHTIEQDHSRPTQAGDER